MSRKKALYKNEQINLFKRTSVMYEHSPKKKKKKVQCMNGMQEF